MAKNVSLLSSPFTIGMLTSIIIQPGNGRFKSSVNGECMLERSLSVCGADAFFVIVAVKEIVESPRTVAVYSKPAMSSVGTCSYSALR